ncbi:hypothetical protein L873DRAFT_356440 [Choiromyces venosus 120613-1]|uniref:Uncharacterized protein n=1 Tax=Choiromyces venosus 120613-1 TaxID=1336337 RepID=A0A3N4J341_9PEZI|nr:hypothetical protein L873DRAFT_356440 [Choiromyces venosus 120613-1]
MCLPQFKTWRQPGCTHPISSSISANKLFRFRFIPTNSQNTNSQLPPERVHLPGGPKDKSRDRSTDSPLLPHQKHTTVLVSQFVLPLWVFLWMAYQYSSLSNIL